MARFLDELRHGNWIIYLGSEIAIRDVEMIELCSGVGNPKPIPLTEEWLKGVGFDMVKFKNIDVIYGTMYAYKNEETGGFDICLSIGRHVTDSELIPHIQHVHQLQNLYYALTGEELQFKTRG